MTPLKLWIPACAGIMDKMGKLSVDLNGWDRYLHRYQLFDLAGEFHDDF
jgi:hypothetical protein